MAINARLREQRERFRQEHVQLRVAMAAAKTHESERVAALVAEIHGLRLAGESPSPSPDLHVHAEQSPEPAVQQWEQEVVDRAGKLPPNYRHAVVMMLRQGVTDADDSRPMNYKTIGKWAAVAHENTIRLQIHDLVRSKGRSGTRFKAFGLKVARYLVATGHR